jgi:hypothetical protein
MRTRSFALSTLAVLVLSGAAIGACGGGGAEGEGAANPASSSSAADTSAATTAPTDTGATTAAATATASAPPPAPTLPMTFTAAADALNSASQALVDEVKANIKDCKKVAAAFDKFTKDKQNGQLLQTYLSERSKLTPDQVDLANQKYPPDSLDKQMSSVGDDGKKCQKDPKVKKAVQGFMTMFMGALQGSASGGAGGAAPASSSKP